MRFFDKGHIERLQVASGQRQRPQAHKTAPVVAKRSNEDEIRARVAFAGHSNPEIKADAAERYIAEGLTPEQVSERIYDLIMEPAEASKIIAQYRASKARG